MTILRRVKPEAVPANTLSPIKPAEMLAATHIVDSVRTGGEAALREHALRLGDIASVDDPLLIGSEGMHAALDAVPPETRAVLDRAAARIRAFAAAQRESVRPFDLPVPGGIARQEIAPVEAAGCYAPGGRYPLPSSVLMTAITAREAGVPRVIVASPRPAPVTLAAAALAGADAVLAVGGAQAVAALAYGVPGVVGRTDAIVGPGNVFVTAAKQLVSGIVRIDMLAGPSELLVLADDTADPGTVAADLLAQAEHDPDATPVLISTSSELIDEVDAELVRQLDTLPTAEVARRACENGFACLAADIDQAITITNTVAPEHLEVHTREAAEVARRITHYGAAFVGHGSAEVLGDYGIGPNHTLPTGGSARSFGGLSVFDFLRIRTVIDISDPERCRPAVEEAAVFARLEGLEAHARSAERRLVASTAPATRRDESR